MTEKLHQIVIDCERMKYPHTGLYHFCYRLGKALLQQQRSDELVFYVPPTMKEVFGKEAHYLLQSSLHKFVLPSTRSYSIWHSTYQASSYFPFKKGLRVVLTIHDLNFLYDETKSPERISRYLKKMQAKVDRADHIVAISEFTLNDVRRHLNLGSKPVSVIYNGCNIEPIEILETPAAAPKGKFLFTIGTIIAKKNFHTLPCLLVDNDFQLVIAGITQRAEYKAKIIAEAKRYGVADRLVFAGPVSENDKQWYLKNCAAFLFPSISEGFGLPVVEAMYFGKPVLLSTHTCLPEIGGTQAYYFENFDPAHMQSVLKNSLIDFETNDRAAAIMERASRFSWERCAAEYYEVYDRLLGR